MKKSCKIAATSRFLLPLALTSALRLWGLQHRAPTFKSRAQQTANNGDRDVVAATAADRVSVIELGSFVVAVAWYRDSAAAGKWKFLLLIYSFQAAVRLDVLAVNHSSLGRFAEVPHGTSIPRPACYPVQCDRPTDGRGGA